ncbi:hypothetical protein HY468_04090 [Candidatus Roizmanbacteria bacterium]|nr:hypothetical protein [Candidatus Roizmanbacteria bacterium]
MTKTAAIVGPPNHRWGQTFIHSHLFVVIEIDHHEQAATVGHDLINTIEERYQTSSDISLATVKQLILDLPLPAQTSLLVGVLHKNILYVTGHGEGNVFILRNDTFGAIFSGNGAVSGRLEQNDTAFFCSPTFTTLSEKLLKQESTAYSQFEELEEILARNLHQLDAASGAACLIVRYEAVPESHEASHASLITSPSVPSKFDAIRQLLGRVTKTSYMPSTKSQRITILIGMLLLMLLITSLVVGTEHRKRMQQKESFERVLGVATEAMGKAGEIIAFNEPEAKQLLTDAKQQVETSLPNFPSDSTERKELEKFLADIDTKLARAERKFILADVPLFFDITWIKEDGSGNRLGIFEDLLVILDRNHQSLYNLSLAKKQSSILVSRAELSSATAVTVHGTKIFILLTDGKRIVDEGFNEIAQLDQSWGEMSSLESFAANLYLLDATGKIWKYTRLEEGYSKPANWLSDEASVDLANVRDMSIDGNIWVLTEDDVLKFTGGSPDIFFLKEETLTSPKALYTNETINKLYILDGERIVVFTKEGKYAEQYLWNKLGRAEDLVVVPSLKKILVLIEGKIYGIDLIE